MQDWIVFMPAWFEKGGPVMWPLLACSIVAMTFAIERLVFWWRESRRHNQDVVDHIFRCIERGEYEEADCARKSRPDAAARMLLNGLAHREHGLTESMEVAASNEIDRMKRGLPVLDTIITMAPLLGILGTVTGIIKSFNLLGSGVIGDLRDVGGGIAEALITTAAGLVIALVALVPFNYFVSRVDKATRNLERIATRFEVAYRRGLSHASEKRI